MLHECVAQRSGTTFLTKLIESQILDGQAANKSVIEQSFSITISNVSEKTARYVNSELTTKKALPGLQLKRALFDTELQ